MMSTFNGFTLLLIFLVAIDIVFLHMTFELLHVRRFAAHIIDIDCCSP